MKTTTETLPGGTQVYTSANHRFGTDALLLARFCGAKYAFKVCDLGSGCGIVLLSLVDAGLRGQAVGVEIDPEGSALLAAAAQAQGLAHVRAEQCDWRAYKTETLFDLVVANPPYFAAGPLPPTAQRAAARHEVHGGLAELCAAATRLLKDRGRFCVCYPPARLAALFAQMQQHGLSPKRLQLVRKTSATPPWLALVDARKAGGEGLQILPDKLLPPGEKEHF